MATVSEELLKQVATRVAQQVHRSPSHVNAWPERCSLLVLSGNGETLDSVLARLAAEQSTIVAVADCHSAAASALAAARARIPSIVVMSDDSFDVDALVARAERVIAPAMDLALASRVAALQADTPGSRVLLRALFRGLPVEVTLAEREFHVSERAPDGARRAVEQIEARLRSLGLTIVRSEYVPQRAAARAASAFSNSPIESPVSRATSARPHPSQDRFELPRSVDEFVDFLEQKGCSIEPGKPCIDCGACEARGF
jgi:hypothetical protein